MEKKTIAKLAVSGAIALAGLLCALGVGRGGNTTYQPPGPYTAESVNDFSTVQVAMTIQGEKITDCEITSSGDSDLLNDEIRAQWAQSIVDSQSAENDVISSATLTYSAASVKEAAADIFAQAGLPVPEPAEADEAEPAEEAEAPAEEAAQAESNGEATAEAGDLADGVYTAEAANDFSTVSVEATVEGGRIAAATVSSDGGATDLLTDDIRAAWGDAIVEAQSADADAISGATLTFSAASVKEAVDDILAQAGSGQAAGDSGERVAELEAALAEAEARAAEAEAKVVELEAAAAAIADSEGAAAGEAEAPILADGVYTAEAANDFSTVSVEATVEGGRIAAATVSSDGGATDLLTDDIRAAWGDAIVEAQSADADAISGATLTFSAASVKEAVDDILTQAGSGQAAAEETAKAVSDTEADSGDLSAYARLRPAANDDAEAAAEPEDSADLSAYARLRPTADDDAEASAEPEASGDLSAYARLRPAADDVNAPAEPEASGDLSAYARLRPAADDDVNAPAEPEASGDLSAYARLRPAADDDVNAPAEPEANGDLSAYARLRPAADDDAEATAEPEASGDLSAYARLRPAADDDAKSATALTEE